MSLNLLIYIICNYYISLHGIFSLIQFLSDICFHTDVAALLWQFNLRLMHDGMQSSLGTNNNNP